jgi:hypothetical protein
MNAVWRSERMPNYENETCLSCHFFRTEDRDIFACANKTIVDEDLKGWPCNDDYCDQFTPSLECRKVRALEKLATSMGDDATISIRDYGAV